MRSIFQIQRAYWCIVLDSPSFNLIMFYFASPIPPSNWCRIRIQKIRMSKNSSEQGDLYYANMKTVYVVLWLWINNCFEWSSRLSALMCRVGGLTCIPVSDWSCQSHVAKRRANSSNSSSWKVTSYCCFPLLSSVAMQRQTAVTVHLKS